MSEEQKLQVLEFSTPLDFVEKISRSQGVKIQSGTDFYYIYPGSFLVKRDKDDSKADHTLWLYKDENPVVGFSSVATTIKVLRSNGINLGTDNVYLL